MDALEMDALLINSLMPGTYTAHRETESGGKELWNGLLANMYFTVLSYPLAQSGGGDLNYEMYWVDELVSVGCMTDILSVVT